MVRPVRGVVDLVLVRQSAGVIVVAEAQSELRRLEQQIRWSMDKAAAIESARIPLPPSPASVSRLLILRSTATTRDLARSFETTLRTAYPAATRDVVGALTAGGAWPGAGIAWVRIEGDLVELLDGPPRGVALGR